MKDIKGYENRYAITSCGRVYSYLTHKFLKACPNQTDGYLQVCLRAANGKQSVKKVHLLVAEAYLINPDYIQFNQVGHKDENKLNNCVNNLEFTNAALNNAMPQRRARISQALANTPHICNYKIKCVETNQIFNSYKEVAAAQCRSCSTVKTCIKRGWAVNGLHFIKEV